MLSCEAPGYWMWVGGSNAMAIALSSLRPCRYDSVGPETQSEVFKLVKNGQLEFIGGGWVQVNFLPNMYVTG